MCGQYISIKISKILLALTLITLIMCTVHVVVNSQSFRLYPTTLLVEGNNGTSPMVNSEQASQPLTTGEFGYLMLIGICAVIVSAVVCAKFIRNRYGNGKRTT